MSQVSKISSFLLVVFLLVFQQFAVGSSLAAGLPDSISDPSVNPSLHTDSLIISSDTLVPVDNLQGSDTLSISTDTLISGDNTLKSKIKYHAKDSIIADLQNKTVHLYGSATVDYEDLHLESEYIKIDMEHKELYAEGMPDSLGKIIGSPKYSQGAQEFRSNALRYNFDTKKGRISYVITQEGDGYIHGEVVKKDPSNNFFIRHGQYTTCNLDTPHYSIFSNRLKVISNNKIVTGPAYLTIEKVPTPLVLPFGFFPNRKGRSSGLIFPAFGESAERGFYFQHLGYYFGFNDYINLALTTDLYTKGSYTIDAATVYKKRYRYSGNMRLSYAYSINSEKELPDFSAQKDFHIFWTHAQDPKANPNRSFNANVSAGSSKYYQNTISSVNNFLSNTFQSSIAYARTFPDKPINLGVSVNHSQNIITKDIRITAPDVSFNVSRISPFKRKVVIGSQRWYEKIGTSYSMRATNYIQTKDTLLFKEESLKEFKNGIQHSIPVSTSFKLFKYFTLSPTANYTERWYFKTTEYDWNPENLKIDTMVVNKFAAARDYQFSAGLSTRVYGMYQMKRGPVAAVRHVLTPTASFNYRPDFGKENYGYYKTIQTDTSGNTLTYSRFQNTVYGGPSSGKFGSLAFGLDNNLEMKVRTRSDTGATEKKIKLLESLRLGTNYNLIADSMKWSPLSISARTTLFNRIGINFNGTLNPYAVDEFNRDYDRFLHDQNGHLFRLTNANVSMSFSLAKNKQQTSQKYTRQELDYIYLHPEEYIDFNIPYNVNVSYTYSFSRQGNLSSVTNQSASISGDLTVTPQWKVGFNSWYDLVDGRFTNFGVNIYRDLHCWEMRLNWIPFGFQESYNFQINVKSAILQDLKLIKRKDFYDR